MSERWFRGCVWAVAVAALLLGGVADAWAQIDPVKLVLEPQNLGLGGLARPGTCVPVRLLLTNQTSTPRAVVCRWELPDPDGDLMNLERPATLSPGRTQEVWLYGFPGLNSKIEAWNFSVLDAGTGEALAQMPGSATGVVGDRLRIIGVSGGLPRGFEALRNDPSGSGPGGLNYGLVTQHEATQFVTNLSPRDLPDRWYGLSLLRAYLWTPEGGDPGSPAVNPESVKALREWVRRGGHLVVILPSAQDWWSQSPLSDMLPVEVAPRPDLPIPGWLGVVPPLPDAAVGTRPRVEARQIKVREGSEGRVSVLCRDEVGSPLAVAGRYGFGRVTLLGIDVTAPEVSRLGLPSGRYNLWHDVFNWRSEAIPWKQLEEYARDNQLYRPDYRAKATRDVEFIDRTIDMRETVGPLLLAASALFAAYWLIACPVSWYVLRQRKLERHSWVVFTATACVFGAVAWVGAGLARPAEARLAYFSVVDLDGATSQAHVTGWATVFVPTHGRATMDLSAGDKAAPANGPSGAIWTIGSLSDKSASSFLNPQTCRVDAAAPSAIDPPFRGTAKRVQMDWRGPLDALVWAGDAAPTTPSPATRPAASTLPSSGHGIRGKMQRKGDVLMGALTHDYPATLRDVRVIYPAGDGREPWVVAAGDWQPGQGLDLRQLSQAVDASGQPTRARLAQKPASPDAPWDGYLGQLMRYAPGETVDQPGVGFLPSELRQRCELLTFFDNLPPPRSLAQKQISIMSTGEEREVVRGPGRSLDMSAALRLNRVIVLAHCNDGPLMAPLRVDGRTLPSRGWTLVRWVGELEPAGP